MAFIKWPPPSRLCSEDTSWGVLETPGEFYLLTLAMVMSVTVMVMVVMVMHSMKWQVFSTPSLNYLSFLYMVPSHPVWVASLTVRSLECVCAGVYVFCH